MRGERRRQKASALLVALTVLCGAVSAAEKATPTPTPAEDLAALAKSLRIHPDAPRSESGGVLITNQSLVDTTDNSMTREGQSPETLPVAGGGSPATTGPQGSLTSVGATDTVMVQWQNRYRQLIDRRHLLEGRLQTTSQELPELWRRFYHEDDPTARDAIIRAELERALREREHLVTERKKIDEDLQRFFVEARKAGALPGWFREVDQSNEK